jgi:phosphatidylglycerophosphatase A
MHNILRFCSTLGPIGYLPASGTIATVIIFLFGYIARTTDSLSGWLLIIIVIILAICTHYYSRTLPETDPHYIISDEMIASLLLVWLIPLSFGYFLLTCLLFRLFDIVKPLGIKQSEKLSGSYGIIADDLLAGFYTLIIIRLIQLFI